MIHSNCSHNWVELLEVIVQSWNLRLGFLPKSASRTAGAAVSFRRVNRVSNVLSISILPAPPMMMTPPFLYEHIVISLI